MIISAATAGDGAGTLQKTLQAVVQSVQWTYSLFWHFCPQQGVLVWGDGYYNGGIKTRKTVQPVEVSTEEAALQRSQQLRELYESLSTGEANLPARRPCAALSPEDLTEAEWFYLMCISFTFPPAAGLPGKAFAQQRYVWLTGASEVDSKVFSRAILAKSAQIQTVVCIPLVDGVLELGNVEKVEEDAALIQHARRFFGDYLETHTKPVLSEQSTSNLLFQQPPPPIAHQQMSVDFRGQHDEDADRDHNDGNYDDDEDDDDDDDEEDDEDEGDEEDGEDVEGSNCRSGGQGIRSNSTAVVVDVSDNLMAVDGVVNEVTTSELMQVEMPEEMRRVGSPSDCSNVGSQSKVQMQDDRSYRNWHFLLEDLGTQLQEFSPEDAHYSETVSSILRHNLKRWADVDASFRYSIHSAFLKWSHYKREQCYSNRPQKTTSQWLVKRVLLNIRELHCKFSDAGSSPKSHKGTTTTATAQEEGSANHVLAERRRREKLNERFMILRALVPFVTKMDKASILGDTIEYVKQLRKNIQDLEVKNKQIESCWRLNRTKQQQQQQQQSTRKKGKPSASGNQELLDNRLSEFEKRKLSVVDPNNRVLNPPKTSEAATSVCVSVVESEVILELQCSFRDGLVLRILQTLQELSLEVTSIQYSSTDGVSNVELHSQMKEVQGKRAGIDDVRKAIHQIIV